MQPQLRRARLLLLLQLLSLSRMILQALHGAEATSICRTMKKHLRTQQKVQGSLQAAVVALELLEQQGTLDVYCMAIVKQSWLKHSQD
jgi:hypothetical protein